MKQYVSVISWNHGMIGLEGSLKITQNHVITAWLGLEVSLQPPKPHPCSGLLPPLHQTRAPFMSLSTPTHGAPTLLRAAVPVLARQVAFLTFYHSLGALIQAWLQSNATARHWVDVVILSYPDNTMQTIVPHISRYSDDS